jgi:hypothetical protein
METKNAVQKKMDKLMDEKKGNRSERKGKKRA